MRLTYKSSPHCNITSSHWRSLIILIVLVPLFDFSAKADGPLDGKKVHLEKWIFTDPQHKAGDLGPMSKDLSSPRNPIHPTTGEAFTVDIPVNAPGDVAGYLDFGGVHDWGNNLTMKVELRDTGPRTTEVKITSTVFDCPMKDPVTDAC